MYRKILMATDLSEASRPAFDAALGLARRLGADLHVLHVTEPPYESRRWFVSFAGHEAEFFEGIARREDEAARKLLDDIVRKANADGGSSEPVHVLVRRGVPADIIVGTAKDLEVDLIVVGTHGRRGIQHALLGSIAERVVRTASCPVLSVRAGVK